MHRSYYRGFSLIELLVVVSIIGILIGAVVVVNVGGIRGGARDAERKSDIAVILSAVYQYALDNNNQLPSAITTTPTEICRTGASSCAGLTDLAVLTTNQKYLPSMPIDPTSSSTVSTNYVISKNVNNRVTIVAPLTEGTTTPFSVTR